MTETIWDQSYPPSVLNPTPPVVPVTGATAGAPGAWVPGNAYPIPTSVAEANALGLSLGAAWTTGQYVVLRDGSEAYWDSNSWEQGRKAASPPAPTTATAGKPGFYGPTGAANPTNLAAMASITAIPSTAWTTGQFVNVADGTRAHWTSSAWAAGPA